jgi:hypothetical protein
MSDGNYVHNDLDTSEFSRAMDMLSDAFGKVRAIFLERFSSAFIDATEKFYELTKPERKLSYKQLQRLTPCERTEYARRRGRQVYNAR